MEVKGASEASKIISSVKQGKFFPVYILYGKEAYYIDKICDEIVNNALTDEEKDFNFAQYYGLDANVKEIILSCKRFPMMSARVLVVVKEAQLLANPDILNVYISQPLKSTVLVICCKGEKFKAPETLKTAKKSKDVIVFESPEVKDYAVPEIVASYFRGKGYAIDSKAVSMIADFVGTDISRIIGEADKLMIVAGENKMITPEMIERNIGISKDYNNFELEDAIKNRNLEKAMRIVNYFRKNPAKNPTAPTVAYLFTFFADLLLIQTSRDKSIDALMERLNAKSNYRVKKLIEVARFYSATSCFNCIGHLREFDRKSKGMDSRQNEFELFKELLYKIINS